MLVYFAERVKWTKDGAMWVSSGRALRRPTGDRIVNLDALAAALQVLHSFAWRQGTRSRYWLPDGKDDVPANRVYGQRAERAAQAAQIDAKGGKRVGRLTVAAKEQRDTARKAKAERVFVPSRPELLPGPDDAVRADPGAQLPTGLAGGTARPRATTAARGKLPPKPVTPAKVPAAGKAALTPGRLDAMRRRVEAGAVTSRALNWGYDFGKARAALADAARRIDAYAGKNPRATVELAKRVTGTEASTPADAAKALKEWVGETLALLSREPSVPRDRAGKSKPMSEGAELRRAAWFERVAPRLAGARAVAEAFAR